jgi:predicted transglutaminase-like cysteine proteinase
MDTELRTATVYIKPRSTHLLTLGAVLALGMLLTAMPVHAITSPLVSRNQVGSSDISPFTKWTAVMPRYEVQHAEAQNACIGKGCLNQKWEALLVELNSKPLQTQITEVNKFFNGMTYITDQNNYGTADYWQTPYEMMERGGDCEDYAIAKYISLKRLGVSESDMRVLIVKDGKLNNTIHAVLQIEVDGMAQILDNQEKSVKPVAKVFHYNPVFAINETNWWAYK